MGSTRYWVGKTSNATLTDWNNPLSWSSTKNGKPGASVPTTEDDVVFTMNIKWYMQLWYKIKYRLFIR